MLRLCWARPFPGEQHGWIVTGPNWLEEKLLAGQCGAGEAGA